ncbi:hypothetical protein [Limnoglobus roseus]|uniref:Uncharacterized protein n=1 Tax=Limnoglobus roseus TaxID=2598579 RepID=A0A5C1AH02_9BACT|nr:hypothetical protein [Limnoglobus roseus]QEL17437.1 hypothetical protein PX52LOC_04426 [Limnoglobus roseus]
MAAPDFPFADGEQVLVQDGAGRRFTLTCRYRYAAGVPTGYVLQTNYGTLAAYDKLADEFEVTAAGEILPVTAGRVK